MGHFLNCNFYVLFVICLSHSRACCEIAVIEGPFEEDILRLFADVEAMESALPQSERDKLMNCGLADTESELQRLKDQLQQEKRKNQALNSIIESQRVEAKHRKVAVGNALKDCLGEEGVDTVAFDKLVKLNVEESKEKRCRETVDSRQTRVFGCFSSHAREKRRRKRERWDNSMKEKKSKVLQEVRQQQGGDSPTGR